MSSATPVFLIDDDKDLLRATGQTLELAGFEVSRFSSAAEALGRIEQNFAGVVVSDIRMPGLDGLQLFQRIRQMDHELPVILMTGHGDIPMAVKAIQDGVYDFIAKPFATERLVQCVRRAAEKLAGSGVVLAIEPLNDRVDHPGYFLTSTIEGLDIVDEVGRPEVRLLYDIYHAAVMGESIELLDGRVDRVAHAHLADVPGRHEPGSGTLDWQRRIDWLDAHGYTGLVGLEYVPLAGGVPELVFPGQR